MWGLAKAFYQRICPTWMLSHLQPGKPRSLLVMGYLSLLAVLFLFQNCGQTESTVIGNSSNSSNPILDESGESTLTQPEIRYSQRACTSQPILHVAGNQYMNRDGIRASTLPILIRFDLGSMSSEVTYPRSHQLWASSTNLGNSQGLWGYNLSLAFDQTETPHLIGRESYAERTRNCAYKSFVWQSMTALEEVLVPSGSQSNPLELAPYQIVATVLHGLEVYSAINLIGTDDDSACTRTVSTNKPTVPAIYSHTTGAVQFLQTESPQEKVSGLYVENDKLVAVGLAPGGVPILWKDGQRTVLALQNAAFSHFDHSRGDKFFARLQSTGANTWNLKVWKNTSLQGERAISSIVATLQGFDAELGQTYSLIREDTGRLFYLVNEQTQVVLDTTGFRGCTGIDIKSFNGKVYVLGSCTRPDGARSFVAWIDGQSPLVIHSGTLENTSTTKFEVGCWTEDGFFTNLTRED